MTSEKIMKMIEGGESQSVEFKQTIPPPQLIARYISAFANTDGGTVLFGIREPNIIVGINPQQFEKSVNAALARTTGSFETSKHVEIIEGKPVGILTIKRSQSIVGTNDGIFTRVGERTQPLQSIEIAAKTTKTPDHAEAIKTLSETISKQTDEISKLREAFEKANSWKRKLLYAVIGAIATGIGKAVFVLLTGGG